MGNGTALFFILLFSFLHILLSLIATSYLVFDMETQLANLWQHNLCLLNRFMWSILLTCAISSNVVNLLVDMLQHTESAYFLYSIKKQLNWLALEPQKMETSNQIHEEKYAADISSIREAQSRIKDFIHKTPVLTSESLNAISGRNLFFKCECFQKGGAFKFRGACNAIYSLDANQAAKGVVTHSSGNHAAALALAAKLRGIPAYIVVPKNAPNCKVENVKRYGGQLIWSEPTMQSRESVAAKVVQDTGAVLIHPYNDPRIISGQGTVSLELLEQIPHIDIIVVPISGGGLISGVALAAKAINPSVRILAAEPRGANDAAQSKAAGKIIILPETNTIADGLRAFLGSLTWPVVRDLVDDVITVDDEEIIAAMRKCYEILKVAVEPSGAIGLAAVLSDSFQKNPKWKDCSNVCIVLSGGNVDLAVLWDSLSR